MTPETEMGSLDLALPPQDKEKQLSKSNAQAQQSLPCPRCDSLSTKFCYFNNYNLAQPRHYCRSCKRYWTHGGSLRNIPVGGSSRKNNSSSSSSSKRRALATVARRGATPPLRKPHMESSHVVGSGMNVTSSGLILGFRPFEFELIPGFDALQGFGFGHAGPVNSSGIDRWRLEDALVLGGNYEEFLVSSDLSMSKPTKGLN